MDINGKNIKENILLANHTTFRIGGPARYFFGVQTKEDLIEALKWARQKSLPYFILGGGSNLLVNDEGFDGLVIKVKSEELKVKNDGDKLIIKAEAGVTLIKIILETTKLGYSGVEWGFGIPGTIGGAICGNAGRLGQDISGVVKEVAILDKDLNEKKLLASECGFGYRESRFKKTNDIILQVLLEFKRKELTAINQVLNEAKEVIKKSPPFPSAGCVFKNYKVAKNDVLIKNHPELNERVRGGKMGVGHLIDQCDLKGKQIGGAKIWEGHANYIVNTGGAKATHVISLINVCRDSVKEKYGIILEEEIRYVGF